MARLQSNPVFTGGPCCAFHEQGDTGCPGVCPCVVLGRLGRCWQGLQRHSHDRVSGPR